MHLLSSFRHLINASLVTGRSRARVSICFALAVAFLIPPSPTLFACQLCTPFPRSSVADYLMAADAVVLAREDPERPFHLAAVEVLKGDPGEEPIELFLDSTTRRILAAKSDRSVVLTLNRADCGAAIWQRVAMADNDLEPIVRHIIASEEDWQKDPELRVDYFDEWLGHSNRQLRNLAHLEIARAPYPRILECRDVLSRKEILHFLADLRYLKWHHLYILLLSAKADPEDHDRIRESFYSNARFGNARTQEAWAAAYIEIEGAKAIASIEEQYFRHSSRTTEELKAVLKALSVHGTNGHVHLRNRIMESYSVLLSHHPEQAVEILKDLQSWKRSELVTDIAAIVSQPPSEIDSDALKQLQNYTLSNMRGNLRPARAPMLP